MKMDERRESRSNQTTRAAAVLPNTKTNTHTSTHVHTLYCLVSSTQIETAFSFLWIADTLKGAGARDMMADLCTVNIK